MNDLEQLEREIAAMRPHEPSPELERRIAAQLAEGAEPATTERPRAARIRWSIAGGFLAASLVAVGLWIARSDDHNGQTGVDVTQVQSAIAFDESLPSVWSYRMASKQSGDSLETLLDRHGEKSRTSQSTGHHIAAFSPFNRVAHLLITEL